MKKETKILLIIFIITLGFRLFFVFQTPYFSTDDSYFNIRHTEYIGDNIKPITYDELSYGGRDVISSHVFHYTLAFFNIFLPDNLTYKLIPAILISTLIFIVYGISFALTKNKNASLLSAAMAGFVPILIGTTVNQVSPYALVFPLLFYSVYCLLNLETKINQFIILSFLFPLLHPLSFLFSISLIFYIILLSVDSLKASKLTKEAVVFSVFINILINFIVYKKAFLAYGLYAVWRNIPVEMLFSYFKDVTVLDIISGIGVVPLLFGIFGFTLGIFKGKRQYIYLLGAMILADLLLLFLRLITFPVGIMFLGILLAVISAISFNAMSKYMAMTKFSSYKTYLRIILIGVILVSLILPSYGHAKISIQSTISENEVRTLEWINENAEKNSVVLSSIEEGNYITSIAKRKNVADSNFILAQNRYDDVKAMYKTESLVQATQLLKKYNIDYIYLSDKAKEIYSIKQLVYIKDDACFDEIYSTEKTSVYEVIC